MADLNACHREVVACTVLILFLLTFSLLGLLTPMWSITDPKVDTKIDTDQSSFQEEEDEDAYQSHNGLFISCGFRPTLCDYYRFEKIPGWLFGVQAMICLGVLCVLGVIGLVPTYFCEVYQKNMARQLSYPRQTLMMMALCFVSAFFYLIGVIVYPIMEDWDVNNIGITYFLVWVAIALDLLTGIAFLQIYRKDVAVTEWLRN